jgi:hypothetical protein
MSDNLYYNVKQRVYEDFYGSRRKIADCVSSEDAEQVVIHLNMWVRRFNHAGDSVGEFQPRNDRDDGPNGQWSW